MALQSLHSQMGPALRKLLRWLFGQIHYPKAQLEQALAASAEATPVFIIRGSSFWLALCFLHVASRVGLAPIYLMGGVDLFWHSPRQWLSRRFWALFGRALPAAEPEHKRAAMAEHVRAGRATLIMLPVHSSATDVLEDWNDYLALLLQLERDAAGQPAQRPILLLPHTLVSRDQSGRTGIRWLDHLFGSNRRPKSLRLWSMLLVFRTGSMRLGNPILLKDALAQAPEKSVHALARQVRRALHHRMDEEERVVAGPLLSAYDTMAKKVLGDKALRATIVHEAQTSGQSEPLLEVKSARKLREIAANYDVRIIRAMEHVLFQIFYRIYDGIVIDEPGLSAVIEASRKAPVVFCPSHKSHVDYLVLSYVLWTHGIAPPHVAAGANLNFFPLGALFRRCGAFFLRRSFRGDDLYAATMRSYIAYLVGQGISLEFFLEGTRSRTGKLLPPRFGLLRMIMHAWRTGARDDVLFVPVSIDYERIIEAKAYGMELKGASKRAESLRGLLRSWQVLRSRYGRLNVQFGTPISLKQFAAEHALPASQSKSHDEAYRSTAERLGYKILHDVAMACSVTPMGVVATALLAHPARGMAQGSLIARCNAIIDYLGFVSARLVGGLEQPDGRVSHILAAVQRLVGSGEVTMDHAGQSDQEPIYLVTPEARVALDYHKNAIMNYFTPAALLGRAAVRKGAAAPLTYDGLKSDMYALNRILAREFVARADADFSAFFDETLGAMALHELIDVNEAYEVTLKAPATVTALATLLDSYLEAYAVAAEAAMDLRALELTEREFVTRALERAKRAFLEGTISRPESASRTLMETALAWLVDENVLQPRGSGKRAPLRFVEDKGQERLEKLLAQLRLYL